MSKHFQEDLDDGKENDVKALSKRLGKLSIHK